MMDILGRADTSYLYEICWCPWHLLVSLTTTAEYYTNYANVFKCVSVSPESTSQEYACKSSLKNKLHLALIEVQRTTDVCMQPTPNSNE